MNTFKSGTNG